MLHPLGGGHALAGKAVGPGLPGPFIPGWTLAGLRFNAGHSGRPTRLGLSFQHLKPSLLLGDNGLPLGDDGLQLGDDGLLLGDDGQQGLPAGDSQVKTRIHVSDLT